jgi:hypothetical protein
MTAWKEAVVLPVRGACTEASQPSGDVVQEKEKLNLIAFQF